MSGVSKEYLLELEIPPIHEKLDDLQRNTVLLDTMIKAESMENNIIIQKKAELSITLYNEDENIVPEINEDV